MDEILRALEAAVNPTALVVGAGYVGLELTEALRHRGLSVVLVEKLDHVMSVADREMVVPLHDELTRNRVDVRLGLSPHTATASGGRRGRWQLSACCCWRAFTPGMCGFCGTYLIRLLNPPHPNLLPWKIPKPRVWVNTNSGTYHCPGTRWYGRTKVGEYMTQKQARAKGYDPAANRACM